MIFRLSQKLAKKLKTKATTALPLDDNPYADWSCHLFTADRTQYIILSNTKSLYSLVMHGKGVTDDGLFIDRALSTMREFMEVDGQTFAFRRFIAPASHTVQFGKALNRSVTGSMSDLITHAELWLSRGEMSPHEVGIKLNDIWLSALAPSKTERYGKPSEAFKALADDLGAKPT